ncbi:MAG TPA: D-2-hydroxyacid dehydrogenase [Gammaproteobacteria bacterium]|jgi:glycerate dehydrogenase|nr:D-2-hydroxyacid dehydrogenase [Gammaproteobacteria bacterium]
MTLKGVFLDLDTVGFQGDVKLRALEKVLSILRVFGVTPAEKVVENVSDAEVVILNKVKLTAEAIKRFPSVRLICVAATGVNNVDLAAAWEKGIGVSNVPAYSTMAMAQHVFALLLSLNQHLKEYEALMQQGAWKRAPQFTLLDYPIRELAGKRFGILGYGNTGKAVGRVAEAFGMSVLVAARNKDDKRPGRFPLEELLPQVDVLSIHVPLLPETRDLIGPKELTLLKPEAVLINCARGGIVDERALATMLRAGRLAGAAVDVLSEEPPLHGNPLLDPSIPNLIVTPHIAWTSREARQRVVQEMALNIAAFQNGELRNRVA